jgi:23S rRNA pseudouridine1911/1915/1917 synthase
VENRIFPRLRVQSADFYIETRFSVIHEDADLVVVDKPSPLACHPVGSYFEKNLHSLLKGDPRWAHETLRFTHRLDAATSGVVVIAKTALAARSIGIQFMRGEVKKRYRALVFGDAPEEGSIDIPLGHDASSGFQTVRVPDYEAGEAASTRFRRLERSGGYSTLEVEPLTGRTHQIRAHLAFAGHPVVGDKIYIDLTVFQRYVTHGIEPALLRKVKMRRLALHATALELRHPSTGREMLFESPAPDFRRELEP